ncbi:MAG: UDP-N-acetylmuramoyl-L-alanine--D-glutamate ligase [Clostridia bacterium]|nr:UDP-N-acetylmuramoyl-L-alanine--D-glutamate ligase [Clostridia bacterium]
MDRVLVWGMAKSGVAAAGLLAKAGKHVIINDLKTASQLGDSLAPLYGLAIEERLGEDPQGLLESVDTLVISPGIPADHPVAKKARETGIEVISEIELAYRFSKGLLVGVTGTNGKTTTTTLLGEIFSAWGRRTFVVGNIGEPYAAHAQETDEGSVTVCELSSFQLETVSSLRPDISLILNLTEDHLNRHKTMENYARIKERVFMNQTGGDVCVLNYDDPITRGMASRANCRVLFFSRREKVSEGAYVDNGSVVFASNGSEETVIKTEEILLPGTHNLENVLAAVCAAMAAGVDKQVISDTLKRFKGVEHRIEPVRELDGIRYINDSKGTNPDSTIKAVEAMTRPTVILLGGSEKNSDYSQMCGVIKNSPVKYAVLLGDTGEKIGEVLKAAGFTAYEYAGHDFKAAILAAKAHASEGWNVLLSPACASFDMFRDFEHRGEEFKRIVGNLK